MPQYDALFSKNSYIEIADIGTLKSIAEHWRLHNPLTPQMMGHAGERRRIVEADFYFGGDVIYRLEGIDGYWHEACLRPLDE
jgi:hypothetical protein